MAQLLMGMFCGDNHSFDYTPTDVPNLNSVSIYNGIYDEIFASKNGNISFVEENKIWDFDTVFYAMFKNNMFAGNVEFTSDIVSAMRIKGRKKGTYTWSVFFEIPIISNEDFSFERFYGYCRNNVEYEFALVPVINGVEGNLNTNSIESNFDGMYLIEKDVAYHAILNAMIPSTSKRNTGAIIETLGSEYPFYIKNGNANYTSGELQASFIDIGLDNQFDVVNGWKYREQVNAFLTSGKPKILKTEEGKMWLVAIIGDPKESMDGHYQNILTTIQWAETGNSESVADLVDNGLLDLDPRLVR